MVTQDLLAATRPRHPRAVPLDELATWLGSLTPVEVHGELGVSVTGVSLSSARILPGDLYAALPGSRAHGASYALEAVRSGAVAALTDPAGLALLPPGLPTLVVTEPRAVLGLLSARVYDEPATRLRMIGVTGTQGKTTVTRLAEGGLRRAGVGTAVVGTVGTAIAGAEVKTALTTPEAPDLHGLFARMVEEGVTACAMEVSSHALVMGRVDGVVFDVVAFTNLGRDHLDFHTDLEDYYLAKASLFTPERARTGLVSIDDDHGRRLAREAAIPVQTLSVSDPGADWTVTGGSGDATGSTFSLRTPDGSVLQAGVPLPGRFNVANALTAIAVCAGAGFDAAAVARGIAIGGGVPGRLERVDAGQDFAVVVDYAHKPDAVEAALTTLRPLTAGALIVVLGAGGDRDPGKRPLMGELAGRLADVVVVTDDNPRSEDPAAIRAAVLAGVRRGEAEVREVGDRRAAIRAAVRRAGPGDIVLIAGKGHETGQEVGGQVLPFDDRVVAAEELVAR